MHFVEVEFPNQIAFAEAWGGIGVQLRSKTSAEGAKKSALQGFFGMEGSAGFKTGSGAGCSGNPKPPRAARSYEIQRRF